MYRLIKFTFIAIVALLTVSCNGGKVPATSESGDTLRFKYSELLSVVRYDDYTVANISDPWNKGEILHTYVLVPKGTATDHLPQGTIVPVPLTRSLPFTSVHSSLIINLGKQQSIAGVADLKYIKLPFIQQQCANGTIADVGSALSPNIEKIIDTAPDALLISPFENSGGYGKVSELGIPIIECADYMETSALGRAEWMKFYGLLFGASREADSLFAIVDSCYTALKDMASRMPKGRSVIMDKKTGSVWYVPGGHSTIGMMLSDANASYPFASDMHSGSLSLPFETVLERAGNSDVWLFRYDSKHAITYKELLSGYHGYSQMQAFRNHQCYGCNVETSLFYEESPFRPDYHLNDIISIVHPDINGLDSLRYYKPLTGN